MKRVWITRTEPGASQLGSYLSEAGFPSTVAPVVKIQIIQGSPPSGRFDCWTLVSYHAIQSAVNLGWMPTGICAAIGPKTEEALRGHQCSTIVPDEHTSEGLYDLLRNRLAPNARICLISGKSGRGELEDWLRSDGYEVTRWIVYERRYQSPQINASDFDIVVASSAFALSEILATFRLQQLCMDRYPTLIVPSERIALNAREMGFSDVKTSGGASNSAVLSALKSLK